MQLSWIQEWLSFLNTLFSRQKQFFQIWLKWKTFSNCSSHRVKAKQNKIHNKLGDLNFTLWFHPMLSQPSLTWRSKCADNCIICNCPYLRNQKSVINSWEERSCPYWFKFRITTSVFICAIYNSMSCLILNRRQSLGTLRASQCGTWTMFYVHACRAYNNHEQTQIYKRVSFSLRSGLGFESDAQADCKVLLETDLLFIPSCPLRYFNMVSLFLYSSSAFPLAAKERKMKKPVT